MSGAQTPVLEAVRSIWDEWSREQRAFVGEKPPKKGIAYARASYLQTAFEDALGSRLGEGWTVARETRLDAGPRLTAWRMYDIAMITKEQIVGLFELSYGDSNIPHALHNGELKLLGDCDATGADSGRKYAEERDLQPDDMAAVKGRLGSIPVRGLFFVNPGPRRVLDRPQDTMWWETKPSDFQGETRFWSALMLPARTATLREVFGRLAGAGLFCWFYSLCDEDGIELWPEAGAPSLGSEDSDRYSGVRGEANVGG